MCVYLRTHVRLSCTGLRINRRSIPAHYTYVAAFLSLIFRCHVFLIDFFAFRLSSYLPLSILLSFSARASYIDVEKFVREEEEQEERAVTSRCGSSACVAESKRERERMECRRGSLSK